MKILYSIKGFYMVIKEDSFVYQHMINVLEDSETKLLLQLFKHMTEDNLVYIYQKPSTRKKRIVDILAAELDVSVRTVQNKLCHMLSKQTDTSYFFYPTASGIPGEYFINPELAVKSNPYYDDVYRAIVTKLEREARNRKDDIYECECI